MADLFEKFKEVIDSSNNIVFFGGAGVSTESGVPDFRSADGLYNAQKAYGKSPEKMISHSFFMSEDRKSTRLNSSHVCISYAVFCLKKKKSKCF